MKRVIGIDPGTYNCGVGFLEGHAGKLKYLHATTISAPRGKDLFARLRVIQQELEELLDQWKPHEVSIENLFHHKNAKSAFHLGLSRGVAIASCISRELPIYEYAPTKIKMTVTGYGRADKSQVKRMAEMQLGHTLELGFDASDAVAAALCHLVTPQLGAKL